MKELADYFRKLQMDDKHHLGLGDIRLTIAQQDEICTIVANFISSSHVLADSLPISKGEIGQCLIDAQTLLEDTWKHSGTKPDLMHEHRWKVARLLKPKLVNLR